MSISNAIFGGAMSENAIIPGLSLLRAGPRLLSGAHGGEQDGLRAERVVRLDKRDCGCHDPLILGSEPPKAFQPETVIGFGPPSGGFTAVKVYNIPGSEAGTLVSWW